MSENNESQNTTQLEGSELVIKRVLNAPLELVFKVWSEAEHLKRWWGPKGFEWGVSKLDFRPGGFFHYSMIAPDGYRMWGKFLYQEIEPLNKIVWDNCFSDEEGNVVPAPFSSEFPLKIRNTVTFSEHNGTTVISLRGGPLNGTKAEQDFFIGMFESMKEGFGGTFDQLEQYLAKL